MRQRLHTAITLGPGLRHQLPCYLTVLLSEANQAASESLRIGRR